MENITNQYLIDCGFKKIYLDEVIYYKKGDYVLTLILGTYAIVGIIGNQFVIGEITLTTIKDLHQDYLESTKIELNKIEKK
jgi:hypothetical protein